MKRTAWLTGISMLSLVGCLPDSLPATSDAGRVSNETPRELFDRTVFPLMGQCASCHVGAETSPTDMFLGQAQSSDSYYAGITNDRRINGGYIPADAELLTKGTHESNFWWTSDQLQTLTTWLVAEAAVRGTGSGSDVGGTDGGTQVGQSPDAVMQQWASCLAASTTAYDSTQVYQIANMTSSAGACYSCHSPGGAGGAYWDKDKDTMLLRWQAEVFITAPFEVAEAGSAPVTYKMIAGTTKICDKGLEQQNSGGTHPAFDCHQQVNGIDTMTALTQFTTAVQANEDAGMCPAPGMFAPLPM